MTKNDAGGFSAEERAAMKQRAAELKADAKRAKGAAKAAAEKAEQLAKIAQMPDGDREMAERLHEIVESVAPDLAPKLYYGQPGYARDGKVVVFFRSGQMDKERYSTFGVSAQAALDEPTGFWPTSYALIDPTEKAWEQLSEVVRRAAGA
ncbi:MULTISPECIES: DUF1801 domain-containing protein [unclassified Microbacterium]|uniref:DUF1801 domain-containing protein n=1 Tax=unclassified Microbacterium TaxID=2609290 RepID=UPI001DA947B4|nr:MULTISPECIES: DUF1801 domain-containing protein [unclassified Microbacterium]CAH0171136.1 hypothetical protein SRABI121_01753 [Microbacterium sp. Bi121]HWK77922.1 DUF1801 domain-containing protein [Microbacterium sp.]